MRVLMVERRQARLLEILRDDDQHQNRVSLPRAHCPCLSKIGDPTISWSKLL
jgi:hypothetical protein